MFTDERLKPRIVFTKHNVLGFSKHARELLGTKKKQCYPQSAKRPQLLRKVCTTRKYAFVQITVRHIQCKYACIKCT